MGITGSPRWPRVVRRFGNTRRGFTAVMEMNSRVPRGYGFKNDLHYYPSRVPASSTSSERAFSLAGRTLKDKRSQLSEDSVDGLMFLHGLKT